MVLVISW